MLARHRRELRHISESSVVSQCYSATVVRWVLTSTLDTIGLLAKAIDTGSATG